MEYQKKISVIIPIYNAEKYLDRCIDSVVNQTYSNIEIIMVNDGSTDSSKEICQKWKEKDNRIILVDKKNEGVSVARNIGLNMAKGMYISFIDSDDFLEKNMYEEMMRYANENMDNIIVCNYFIETSNKQKNGICQIPSSSWEEEMFEKNSLKGYLWNKLYPKSLIKDLRFDIKLYMMEDLIFNFSLGNESRINYIFVNSNLYHYVIHNESSTKKNNSRKITFLDALKKEIDILESKGKKKSAQREKKSYILKYNLYNILYKKDTYFINSKKVYKNIEKEYLNDSDVKKNFSLKEKIKLIILKKIPIL